MKNRVLFLTAMFFVLLLVGCKHSTGTVDYQANTIVLEADGVSSRISINGSPRIAEYENGAQGWVKGSYYIGNKYKAFVELLKDNGNWSHRRYVDDVYGDIEIFLLSSEDYTGDASNVIGSYVIYSHDKCRLWRYLYLSFSKNHIIRVYGHIDLKEEDFPCKAWKGKNSLSDTQKEIITKMVKDFDNGFEIQYEIQR